MPDEDILTNGLSSGDSESILSHGLSSEGTAMTDPNPSPVSGADMRLVTLPLAVAVQGAYSLIAGDTGPARFVQLTDGDARPLVLPDGTTVTYRLREKDGAGNVGGEAAIVYGPLGLVIYEWQTLIPSAGRYVEQWKVQFPSGQTIHVPTDGYVSVNILAPLDQS